MSPRSEITPAADLLTVNYPSLRSDTVSLYLVTCYQEIIKAKILLILTVTTCCEHNHYILSASRGMPCL